ncbi:MAG TPA: contractile injection system tape measure protein [Chitinophagaceae bacterium]|jgi:hypothetical protein
MTHLVNRLTFDLLCPGEEQAFDMRRQVSSMVVQEQVQEVIDRVCSRYAGEERWINIDQLEVDLGLFNAPSFSGSFSGSFFQKLEDELSAKLAKLVSALPPDSRRVSEMELLQYLLLHGVLPWWGTALEPDANTLCAETISHDAGSFTRFLRQYRFNPSLWKRISYQLNAESQRQIIGLLPALSAAAAYIQTWLDQLQNNPLTGRSPAELSSMSQKTVSQSNALPASAALRSIVQKIVLQNAPRLFQNKEPLDIIQAIARLEADSLPAAETSLLKSLTIPADAAAIIPLSAANDTQGMEAAAGQSQEDEPEKSFIKTAGIVLLAPFFLPFFTELGLLQGNQWINKAASYRAVHLLKMLSTGLPNQPEYGLILEKICCSLPPDEPVPMETELEEKEIAEAGRLLTAVITHWAALKNTSIDGLRDSFFKRDGILTRKGNGWLLQVERKTLDVLVDRIPWVYNPVRLPWNDYLITVEW